MIVSQISCKYWKINPFLYFYGKVERSFIVLLYVKNLGKSNSLGIYWEIVATAKIQFVCHNNKGMRHNNISLPYYSILLQCNTICGCKKGERRDYQIEKHFVLLLLGKQHSIPTSFVEFLRYKKKNWDTIETGTASDRLSSRLGI